MAEAQRGDRLDLPREGGRRFFGRPKALREGAFGVWSEAFARFMGTPQFLVWMTIFVVVWLSWNTFMPEPFQFDPRSLNYTLLTLILSLQASYAAPLLLLAQNRQDDRDRVITEQDRARGERNLSDTEYLTREVAALRLALRDVATRDFVRSELRDLLEEMRDPTPPPAEQPHRRKKKGGEAKRRVSQASKNADKERSGPRQTAPSTEPSRPQPRRTPSDPPAPDVPPQPAEPSRPPEDRMQ